MFYFLFTIDREGSAGATRKGKGHRGGGRRPNFDDEDGKPYQISQKQEIGKFIGLNNPVPAL